jgi:hypothetical protein
LPRREEGPAYRGTLHVDGCDHVVEAWRILDGRRFECLSFAPTNTKPGVLWPARDKLSESSPDFFGTVMLDERRWRLRAWRAAGNAIRVRVKA